MRQLRHLTPLYPLIGLSTLNFLNIFVIKPWYIAVKFYIVKEKSRNKYLIDWSSEKKFRSKDNQHVTSKALPTCLSITILRK